VAYVTVCLGLCIHATTTVLWPFDWDYPGEPATEETFSHTYAGY